MLLGGYEFGGVEIQNFLRGILNFFENLIVGKKKKSKQKISDEGSPNL